MFEGKKSDIPRIKGMVEIRDSLRDVIKTLQDIVNLSPDELKQTKSLSQKGYKEIVQLLKKHGINTDKYKI